jgi:hypothetical protein
VKLQDAFERICNARPHTPAPERGDCKYIEDYEHGKGCPGERETEGPDRCHKCSSQSPHIPAPEEAYESGFGDGYRAGKIDATRTATLAAIKLFEEVEAGMDTYEKENVHQMVRDECRGIYIPTNVVRRLITVRKGKLRQSTTAERKEEQR